MYSIPSLAVMALVSFFLVKGVVGVVEKERESGARSKGIAEQAAAMALREQGLKEGISRLQTEEGKKDEIKARFSVTQAGERVAVIVDDRKTSSSTDDSALPWYKRFWNAIMGNK